VTGALSDRGEVGRNVIAVLSVSNRLPEFISCCTLATCYGSIPFGVSTFPLNGDMSMNNCYRFVAGAILTFVCTSVANANCCWMEYSSPCCGCPADCCDVPCSDDCGCKVVEQKSGDRKYTATSMSAQRFTMIALDGVILAIDGTNGQRWKFNGDSWTDIGKPID
jgi:hypothetical protein